MSPLLAGSKVKPMIYKSKFWPLDYDPEGEIYENPSWDLPGLRRTSKTRPGGKNDPGRRRR
jgi:hypothetical protein